MTTRRRLDRQLDLPDGSDAGDDNEDLVGRSHAHQPNPAGPVRDGRDSPLPLDLAADLPRADAAGRPATDRATTSSDIHGRDKATRQDPSVAGQDQIAETGRSPLEADGMAARDTNDDRSTVEGRAGVDARRRGWFWHWNNVVTQYAPLIGLKGVGLLNSYTVWTDRRDESPHRGYAFPSQQSEAGFYGEERSELITINKILVALDLIEIRKEMLTRVDERGRRWRVPHNLYRVKDRPDGVDLRAHDVLRVVILAKNDQAVFRYVRRIFSERFKPIDGDNVWHAILGELRTDPTWRELQERTRAIEARASARTRAGHQSRAGAGNGTVTSRSKGSTEATTDPDADLGNSPSNISIGVLPDAQQNEPTPLSNLTSVEDTNKGLDSAEETDVERTNSGLAIAVAGTNTAFADSEPTTVAAGSNGQHSVVGPGNTTYDQTDLTTTTTTTSLPENDPEGAAHGRAWLATSESSPAPGGRDVMASERLGGTDEGVANEGGRSVAPGKVAIRQELEEQRERDRNDRRSASARTGESTGERRLADPDAGGPMVDSGPLVVSTFEDANDRRATPLERRLLAELERDADPAARAVGSTGAEWVVASMREAVSSGSAFVAPKRIREIIARWSANPRTAPSTSPAVNRPGDNPPLPPDDAVVDVRLPGGASGDIIWTAALADLARALDRDAYDRLLAGSRITRYWRGTVEISVTSSAAADKLSNEFRGLVERHLNSRLRRPVVVRFVADPVAPPACSPASALIEHAVATVADTPEPLTIAENEVEIGRQVWQSLLSDLARVVSPADLDRMGGVIVLGQDATGAILLGTPSPMARRLIDTRYRADVEHSLASLLGQPAPIRTLDSSDWRLAACD